MTLTGTYHRNLDEKQRVAIPKRLRDEFDSKPLESLFVCPGNENSLTLYTPAEFERLGQRLSAKSSQRPNYRNYIRLFFARSERVPLDNQSRIRIPERLVSLAGLQKELVLLGVHDHAEIWDLAAWNSFLDSHGPTFDEMAAAAFE